MASMISASLLRATNRLTISNGAVPAAVAVAPKALLATRSLSVSSPRRVTASDVAPAAAPATTRTGRATTRAASATTAAAKAKAKEKERADKLKQKMQAQAAKEKEKEKIAKEKERAKAKAAMEKEKEKEKEMAAKEKERAKARAAKEKEKAAKERERAKAKEAKEKERVKAKEAKEKERADAQEKKLKSWELRGPDGKLVPLPSATKPAKPPLYTSFISEQMAKIPRDDPSLQKKNPKGETIFDGSKAFRKIAETWRGMSDADKRPYRDEYEKRYAQYQKDMQKWRESLTSEDIRRQNAYYAAQRKKAGTGPRNIAQPGKMKRPISAFIRYYVQQRTGPLAGMRNADIVKKASEQWREMTEDMKKPYVDEAASEMEKYNQRLKERASA